MNQQLPQKPRSNQMDKVRGLTGVAMGLVYVFVGVFMVFANQKKNITIRGYNCLVGSIPICNLWLVSHLEGLANS
jgi:hypothetical protein